MRRSPSSIRTGHIVWILRVQTPLPAKSKALRTPTPVITQTCRPSVTGEGGRHVLLVFHAVGVRELPLPRYRLVCRSTAHSSSSPLLASVATFRKIMSPQMIGVDPLYAGRRSFQAMLFSTKSVACQGYQTAGPAPQNHQSPAPRGGCEVVTGSATAPHAGRSAAHLAPQETGRPTSRLAPLRDGPRQCGQCSAAAALVNNRTMEVSVARMRITLDTSLIPGCSCDTACSMERSISTVIS